MKKPARKLTQERLKELLHYNLSNGLFIWNTDMGGPAKCGDIAGGIHKATGYMQIFIRSKRYLAHRLAWFYVHGYFPENNIDHIDRNRSNNSIANLREVSHQCNMRNRNINKNNTSGVTGVTFRKKEKRWYAQIKVNSEYIYLGRYVLFSDAVKSRWEGEKKYDFPNCNTTSSAYNYLKERILI